MDTEPKIASVHSSPSVRPPKVSSGSSTTPPSAVPFSAVPSAFARPVENPALMIALTVAELPHARPHPLSSAAKNRKYGSGMVTHAMKPA